MVTTKAKGIALFAGHLKITKNRNTETIGKVASKANVPMLNFSSPFLMKKSQSLCLFDNHINRSSDDLSL